MPDSGFPQLDEKNFSRDLLQGTIAPRTMRWFLVNDDELEQFKKMDAGSSQNLAFGMLAIGIAASFFISRFTVSANLTVAQFSLFYLAPAFLGPVGIWMVRRGTSELSGISADRAKHIERIRSQSGVVTRTEVSSVRPSEELVVVVKETAQVDQKGPDV